MPTKKSFKNDLSPAMQFISHTEEENADVNNEDFANEDSAPAGFKKNPLYVETKSKRLQLLMQPSLHEKLKKRAALENKSINDLIHSIIQQNISV